MAIEDDIIPINVYHKQRNIANIDIQGKILRTGCINP